MQDWPHVLRFQEREQPPPVATPACLPTLQSMLRTDDCVPVFRNGLQLKPYQVESFKWMVQHNIRGTNCMLGDEMGLEKTVQVSICQALQLPAKDCVLLTTDVSSKGVATHEPVVAVVRDNTEFC